MMGDKYGCPLFPKKKEDNEKAGINRFSMGSHRFGRFSKEIVRSRFFCMLQLKNNCIFVEDSRCNEKYDNENETIRGAG